MTEQELKQKISDYLCRQFIIDPSKLPQDECWIEADYILALVKESDKQNDVAHKEGI